MSRGALATAGLTCTLLLLTATTPARAGSLVTSPSTVELEALPGTAVRTVLSVENGLDRSCTLLFRPVQQDTPHGQYDSLPSLS